MTPGTENLLESFSISFTDILQTVLLLLIIPLILGMTCRVKFPRLTQVIEKPIRIVSVLILFAFIGVALVNNFEAFKTYLGAVFLIVLLHNAVAFSSGYFTATLFRAPKADRRSISIETGIQNSGLGLIIIFTFFDGNGGMALIAAWWGIWHIIAGLTLSQVFRLLDKKRIQSA
jgi:BASS family bile acid:Na+ symporter